MLRRGTESPELKAFRTFYHSSLEQNGIVGSSFLLLWGGEPVAEDFHGYADWHAKRRVDRETAYHWASITKTFTAIAVMQLRDQRLITLDDPIVRYVPELRKVHDPFGLVDAITIRHLLTHSAGFRNATWPWGGGNPWQPFEPTEWTQIVAMLPYTEVLFPPGSRHAYSNLGIVFLGQIIERLSGDDYEVYIDKNILKPLQMYVSYFDRAPRYLLPHRSHSYFRKDGKLTEAPFNFDTGITVSNGGLNAPFPDMAKYLQFLVGDAKRKDLYELVLKRSSLDEMFQKQLVIDSTDVSQLPVRKASDSIGLCFFRHEDAGRTYIGHGGDQNGFLSHFYIDLTSRSGYLVAFNTDAAGNGQSTRAVDLEIRTYLFKKVFPFLAR